MRLYTLFLAALLVVSISSCSQKGRELPCAGKVDSLYNIYGKHLIFYCYFSDSINNYTKADSIYDNYMTFYREDIPGKDKQLLDNLTSYACKEKNFNEGVIIAWCDISQKLARIRSITEFTLDGYMNFLSSDSNAVELIKPYLSGNRIVESLSTDEMERIYFRSVDYIIVMGLAQQELFFQKLKQWDFMK